MSNQLYINGKPASLFQRIVAAIIGIGALVIFAFFGLAIFVIGLGVTVVLGLYFWWKTRKIRRQINDELKRANVQGEAAFSSVKNPHKQQDNGKDGNLYEGEYKEL